MQQGADLDFDFLRFFGFTIFITKWNGNSSLSLLGSRQYVQVRSRVYGLVLHIAILLGMSVKWL